MAILLNMELQNNKEKARVTTVFLKDKKESKYLLE